MRHSFSAYGKWQAGHNFTCQPLAMLKTPE